MQILEQAAAWLNRYPMAYQLFYNLVIYYTAVQYLRWLVPAGGRFYRVYCLGCILLFTLSPVQTLNPFLYIALSTLLLSGQVASKLDLFAKACTSVFAVLFTTLLLHSGFTFLIEGFQHKAYNVYLQGLCVLAIGFVIRFLLRRRQPPSLVGRAGVLAVLLQGLLLVFYGYVLTGLPIQSYRNVALVNLFVVVFVVLTAYLFTELYRLRLQNLILKHEAEKQQQAKHYLDQYILLRHLISGFIHELRPYIDAGDMPGTARHFSRLVSTADKLSYPKGDELQNVQDELLRNSLLFTMADIQAGKPYTASLSVTGTVQIPPHLSDAVYSIVRNLIQNAQSYLGKHGGILTITLYGEPGFTSIEVTNTLHPGFDPARLTPRSGRLSLKGNGLKLVGRAVAAHPELIHRQLLLPPNGTPSELSQRLLIHYGQEVK